MDAIIATSEEAASYVENVVATIPHGVDCARFKPCGRRSEAFRSMGLPGKRGVSLIGRIRPEKGTDLFVDAMLRILPQFPEFTACIAGKVAPEHRRFHTRLLERIERAGLSERIVWFGEVEYERMPAFHAAMSLCVAPARYEGFGLVPLEAMACEVPVIASATGCYREIIIPGTHGDLIPCNDLESLVNSLHSLLSNAEKLDEMGKAGRKTIEKSWSAQNEADRIVEVYKQIWSRAA